MTVHLEYKIHEGGDADGVLNSFVIHVYCSMLICVAVSNSSISDVLIRKLNIDQKKVCIEVDKQEKPIATLRISSYF